MSMMTVLSLCACHCLCPAGAIAAAERAAARDCEGHVFGQRGAGAAFAVPADQAACTRRACFRCRAGETFMVVVKEMFAGILG